MADEPFDLFGGSVKPALTNCKHCFWMVLRNIAKVVSNAAAHIKILIVFQRI